MKRKHQEMMKEAEENNTNKKIKREPIKKRKFEFLIEKNTEGEEEDALKKTRMSYYCSTKEKICRRDILLYL